MTPFPTALLGELDRDAAQPLAAPIVVRNAPDQIVERLVTAIALGVYVTGQRLPNERDLAAALDVSRGTVREAFRRLVQDGYLQVRRGHAGGYFVLSQWQSSSAELVRRHLLPHWERFESFFDTRNLLEPLIASTAADRRDDDDVARIDHALRDYETATTREESRGADERLHRAIAAATHNPMLLGISTQMRSLASFNLGAEPYSPALRAAAVQQHRALAAVVVAGSPSEAARLAGEHFRLTEQMLRALVERVRAADEEPSSQAAP